MEIKININCDGTRCGGCAALRSTDNIAEVTFYCAMYETRLEAVRQGTEVARDEDGQPVVGRCLDCIKATE